MQPFFGPLIDIAVRNGYGYRITMQKLNTFSFRRRRVRSDRRCVSRPIAVLLVIVVGFCCAKFANNAQSQSSFDLSTASFTSQAGPEEEIVWDADTNLSDWLTESHFGDPPALECSEAMCAEQDKSICVIKNCWGVTEEVEIRPQDEIWIVSARNCCTSHDEGLEVKRLSSGVWQPSSLEVLGNCHETELKGKCNRTRNQMINRDII